MRSADKNTFDRLITRFLSGEAAVDDRDRLNELLQNSDCKAMFVELQRRWNAAGSSPVGGFDVASAQVRLAVAIEEERRTGSHPDTSRNKLPAATVAPHQDSRR